MSASQIFDFTEMPPEVEVLSLDRGASWPEGRPLGRRPVKLPDHERCDDQLDLPGTHPSPLCEGLKGKRSIGKVGASGDNAIVESCNALLKRWASPVPTAGLLCPCAPRGVRADHRRQHSSMPLCQRLPWPADYDNHRRKARPVLAASIHPRVHEQGSAARVGDA